MNMRNIVLCILYLFLVPMGGFAQSEVVVLYPDTENKDLDEAVYQKIFLAGTCLLRFVTFRLAPHRG